MKVIDIGTYTTPSPLAPTSPPPENEKPFPLLARLVSDLFSQLLRRLHAFSSIAPHRQNRRLKECSKIKLQEMDLLL